MSSPKENENLSFQSQFKLDKAYYKECFEESEANGLAIKPKYGLLILLVALGFFAIYGLQEHYLGNFLILLAVVECLAFYYRKAWWVTRQALSRAAGNVVTVSITDNQIITKASHAEFCYAFNAIEKLIETERGFLVFQSNKPSYISKSGLSAEAIEFLSQKVTKNI
ncbi:YcxB family protein [Pseudoalteromonas sp. McH1-7]|uniref:YcxB family protein n=1 Tax=Pseudoalteromonas TaxID=53246 RepID=UPI000FFF656C|nr:MULTISPECIES: YcxB family protein [Pseudoalteromonas]MDW7547678.1 YcxB family protein [Pseudoalteromonas peptidolytica]NUZ11255.1 YcxB family protein [Pseudoalteromonas sp. McH1-7]RXE98417.1 YcxB family protein [Pseudoalteromonas sp. PS5]USD27697.1 YcxB family protein [Pseudoalteromonas sp. SCSIO 43201]